MNNTDDEVTAPPPSDENCVSGLINSVLALVINILVWLQKTGCKNIPALTDCPETCELLPTLEKLSVFARQADGFEGDSTEGKSCDCPKNGKKEKKEKSDRNLKKAKSGDNHAVLYAVSQEGNFDQDCKKCCKKVLEPKDKKENDNVIFEVVAAEMVENSTQTDTKEFVDCSTQDDSPQPEVVEKEAEAVIPCICMSTQVSTPDITKVETEDAGVQVEIEIKRSIKSVQEGSNESLPTNDSNVKFRDEEDFYACPTPRFEACANDEDDDEEEDFDDEEDEEEDAEPEMYLPCPARCVPYAQARQAGYRQPAPYIRGQPPMRQERPPIYRNYESHPMYNQYNAGYDPYGPMRCPYQPQAQQQPYYQKVTRTIQRGPASPRKAEYQNQLQRQTSPTQRQKADNQSNVEKYPQSRPTTPPSSPTASVQMNKKESASQRDQNLARSKDCVPNCPGNKPVTVRKLSATPVPQQQSAPPPQAPPAQHSPKTHSPVVKKECDPKCPKLNKPIVTEKADVSRTPSKKCVAKCATGGNTNKNQPKTNTQDNKQKPRPVSFMPKGAIPVEPREVLEVEEAPASKQTILADSVMSVEASKRNK